MVSGTWLDAIFASYAGGTSQNWNWFSRTAPSFSFLQKLGDVALEGGRWRTPAGLTTAALQLSQKTFRGTVPFARLTVRLFVWNESLGAHSFKSWKTKHSLLCLNGQLDYEVNLLSTRAVYVNLLGVYLSSLAFSLPVCRSLTCIYAMGQLTTS